MFGPSCSSQTTGCTTVDNSNPNTTKRRYSRLGLVSVASAVVDRVLEVEQELNLTESHTDWYPRVVSQILTLVQTALVQRHIIRSLSSIVGLSDGLALAGQLGGGGSGGTVTMEAIFDSNTAAGEVVYISGDGHVDLAQANSGLTTTAVGIATQDVSAGGTGEYIPVGPVSCDTWTLAPGTVYYLDPNVPGGMTATYPDNFGEFVIILGAAATSKQLNLEIHWMLEQ